MDNEKYHALLILIVPRVIELISNNENQTEEQSTLDFYNSKTYSLLEQEDLKLWHYSALTLYNMYKSEKETGSILFPEGA